MKLISVLPYLLIAAGLFSTLALFWTLKREIRCHVRRQKERIEEMMERLNDAERVSTTSVEKAPEIAHASIPSPLRAGLNLNKRVHAMRMLRRGEDIGHVAAALGVPRKEVELLIRVQSIGKVRAANAGTD